MNRKRSLARELAFQFLFQLDLRGPEALEDLDEFLAENASDAGVRAFAHELAAGAWERRAAVDAALSAAADHWDVRRMAAVDRNVLRLGAHEILHRRDTAPAVAIDEAVELARKYSTPQSPAFVNGVLDRVRIRHETAGPPGKDAAGTADERR